MAVLIRIAFHIERTDQYRAVELTARCVGQIRVESAGQAVVTSSHDNVEYLIAGGFCLLDRIQRINMVHPFADDQFIGHILIHQVEHLCHIGI